MGTDVIRLERHEASVHLVIDNPSARNGITAAAARVAGEALEGVAGDRSVRAVVVRGAGGHFCSGADLRAAARAALAPDAMLRADIREGFHRVIEALAACPVPTLAVIRGACVGFGFDLALACDLRVAANDAVFGQVFSRLGLVPDGGSSHTLPRLVGLGRAMELMLLGERFDGVQAAAWGVVNRAVAPEDLDVLARDWEARLVAGPPIAFRRGKANLLAGAAGSSLAEALDREADAQLACLRTADLGRGVQAFFAKRPPDFKGD